MRSGTFYTQFLSGFLILALTFLIGFPRHLLLRGELPDEKGLPVPGSNPSVCIGYNVSTDRWGEEYQTCADGYAAYGVADAGGKNREGAKIPAVQVCCPLPAKDILTKEEVYVRESCPEDYVATGSRLDFTQGDNGVQYMRCTKINNQRYQLAAPQPSLYFGNGFAGWQGSQRIDREDIPAGIRYAMGRMTKDKWNKEGCVGYPYGSLLTDKTAKVCGGFKFRQLQFKGLAGDPDEGTPVQMFPECKDVSDLKNPSGGICMNG